MSYRILAEPYRRPIPYRPVGIVAGPATVYGEWGGMDTPIRSRGRADRAWARVPKNAQLYARYKDIEPLVRQGKAEALVWRDHGVVSVHIFDGPKVSIIRSDAFWSLTRDEQLSTVFEFAEWVRRFDVQPLTLAGTSRSLWRSTLHKQVFEAGDRPGNLMQLGGRQGMAQPPGIYTDVVLWDLRSAYAHTLGNLWVPHVWRSYSGPGWDENVPHGYARAIVRVPRLSWGPLPIHQRPHNAFVLTPCDGASMLTFPTDQRISGVWTNDELRQAIAVGCDVEILEYWVGRQSKPVFEEWWRIFLNGMQTLSDPAKKLLKISGNTLWGGFVAHGRMRRLWYDDNGTKHRETLAYVVKPRSYSIGGAVSASVRARLFGEALEPWDFVAIACHTDGVWLPNGPHIKLEPNGGDAGRWRRKESGTLHLADPQHYLIQRGDGTESLRMAGMGGRTARRYWDRHFNRWIADAS